MPLTYTADSTTEDVIKIILSIILPPVGVAMEVGFTKPFWINVVLCLFGWLPGVVHAIYIIAKH